MFIISMSTPICTIWKWILNTQVSNRDKNVEMFSLIRFSWSSLKFSFFVFFSLPILEQQLLPHQRDTSNSIVDCVQEFEGTKWKGKSKERKGCKWCGILYFVN